jgi:hypothetical protein
MPLQTTRNPALSSHLKTSKLYQIFDTINSTKFPDTVTETAISIATLKTVLFILLHNVLRLLPANGHDMHKTAAYINFRVAEIYNEKKKACKTCGH